ncbi:unnamed protein product [Periconia digitata]|uniref:Zn(2)-C6 fungal-type domain-containing protein n=1 Tax=Periconia digitata TaxID=1303443 RepID=A0A9W4XLD9_9PLEO|nr:unnamed protein product [Periconia digitata]
MQRQQRPNGEARRRSGCWSCKARHVRCTEERPSCARCVRLGSQCKYGMRLLWQEDAVQRGICLGREGTWSKRKKPVKDGDQIQLRPKPYFVSATGDPIFLHTFSRDFEGKIDMDISDEDVEEERRVQRIDFPRPTKALSYFHQLSGHEAYLLQFYIVAICPNCSLSPIDNPYLYYVTPMATIYPPLRDAVISIAATERRLVNDRRFEKESWLYKSRALRGLQETITSGSVSWPFIATVLMLCFNDIVDGCSESWMTHLRGGLTLINTLSLQANCTESRTLRKFCLMYFVAHDIMGHTAGSSPISSTPYAWLADDDVQEIDPLMGCSRGLLDLIHEISTLGSILDTRLAVRALTALESTQLDNNRSRLEDALYNLHQYPPRSTPNPNIAFVAEAKRTTALLYLHHRLPSQSSTTSHPSPRMAILVDSLIAQLQDLPVTPTLLWPLFMLGNASPQNEEHRRFVLERLGRILEARNLGSVRLARRLVEKRFREWDLRVGEVGGGWKVGVGEAGFRGKLVSLA